jgi:hypothetical protein
MGLSKKDEPFYKEERFSGPNGLKENGPGVGRARFKVCGWNKT